MRLIQCCKSTILQYKIKYLKKEFRDFPGGSVVKSLPANAGDMGSIPGPGRFHMPQSNKAYAPQLLSLCSRALESQLLSPCAKLLKPVSLQPVLRYKRRHGNEKPEHHN